MGVRETVQKGHDSVGIVLLDSPHQGFLAVKDLDSAWTLSAFQSDDLLGSIHSVYDSVMVAHISKFFVIIMLLGPIGAVLGLESGVSAVVLLG